MSRIPFLLSAFVLGLTACMPMESDRDPAPSTTPPTAGQPAPRPALELKRGEMWKVQLKGSNAPQDFFIVEVGAEGLSSSTLRSASATAEVPTGKLPVALVHNITSSGPVFSVTVFFPNGQRVVCRATPTNTPEVWEGFSAYGSAEATSAALARTPLSSTCTITKLVGKL